MDATQDKKALETLPPSPSPSPSPSGPEAPSFIPLCSSSSEDGGSMEFSHSISEGQGRGWSNVIPKIDLEHGKIIHQSAMDATPVKKAVATTPLPSFIPLCSSSSEDGGSMEFSHCMSEGQGRGWSNVIPKIDLEHGKIIHQSAMDATPVKKAVATTPLPSFIPLCSSSSEDGGSMEFFHGMSEGRGRGWSNVLPKIVLEHGKIIPQSAMDATTVKKAVATSPLPSFIPLCRSVSEDGGPMEFCLECRAVIPASHEADVIPVLSQYPQGAAQYETAPMFFGYTQEAEHRQILEVDDGYDSDAASCESVADNFSML